MKSRISRALIALAVVVLPLRADIGGITTSPANLPSEPNEITSGGGYLWILTVSGNLGRMSPGGAYVEYPLKFGTGSQGFSNARDFTYGFDGNIWVSGSNGHIERVTPNGSVTDFAAVSGVNNQTTIVSGADNAMWFFYVPQFGSTSDNTSKLARIDIYGQVTTYPLGLGTDFFGGLVTGGDGSLWFIDSTKNTVVKFSVTTKSVVGTFTIPSSQNGGGSILRGPDGNVWFTHGTSIDRVTPDGSIKEFAIPSGAQPSQLELAGDGNIWFTEYSTGKIGQLVVSSITSGGNVTINETAAISNPEEIVLLPPGFTSTSGKTALDTNPCPPITFLIKQSPPKPPTTAEYVSTTTSVSGCADLNMDFSFENEGLVYAPPGRINAGITLKNGGPNDATNLNIVVSFSTASGAQVDPPVSTVTNCQGGTASISGLTVTVTKPTLANGDQCHFYVYFKNPFSPTISGQAVAFSDTPDPNPKNNAAASVIDGTVAKRGIPLDPDTSGIILTPVIRGK